MNTNVTLAKTFTKSLKETAAGFTGDFTTLISLVLDGEAFTAKMKELSDLIETNRQIEALRAHKRILVAASRPAVALDANGNPVKRGRGRPRKNPLPVVTETAPATTKPAKKTKVVIPDNTDEA